MKGKKKQNHPPDTHTQKPQKKPPKKTHYTLKAQKSGQKPQSANTLHTFNWVVSSWGYYKNKQTNQQTNQNKPKNHHNQTSTLSL